MLKLIYIIVFALFLVSCGNNRSKIFNLSKEELIKEIAEENIVAGGAVGIAAIEPDQWIRFLALKSKTSEQDLIDLTNHPNKAVKCYAFIALTKKKNETIFPLLLKNISDTGKVTTFYGCVMAHVSVGEFYIQEVISGEYISDKQKQVLDSIILFRGDSNLISKFEILENFTPELSYYTLIKERVNRDPKYIIALAKYKNSADRETISHLLKSPDRSIQYWGVRAIINYPDKSFFTQLREIARSNYNTLVEDQEEYLNNLYKALVQYKDKTSKEILRETIQKASGMDSIKKIDLVYGALKNYPDNIYKNLIQYF